MGLTNIPIVSAQLDEAHANPRANRDEAARMPGDFGQLGLLQRLQPLLQPGGTARKPLEKGGWSRGNELAYGCLARFAELCGGARPPGQLWGPPAANTDPLGVELPSRSQMGHGVG